MGSSGNRSEPDGPAGDTGGTAAAVTLRTRLEQYVRAVNDGDAATVEAAVIQLSRSSRLFAPLALLVSGITTLFEGLRLLFTNWRLTVIQILPAVWIWVVMFDWRAHALHGKSFHVLRGPILIPIVLLIAAITAATFVLNAVFGFAVSGPTPPQVRPAFERARSRLGAILLPGFVVGVLLGLVTTVVTRWASPWFAICLGVVVGVMMICYVAVPARLIGVKPVRTRREKFDVAVVSGTMGAIVSTPPYIFGRLAILMLGFHWLFIPGIVLLTFAAILQAATAGAVKAVKLTTTLTERPPSGGRARVAGDKPVEPSDARGA